MQDKMLVPLVGHQLALILLAVGATVTPTTPVSLEMVDHEARESHSTLTDTPERSKRLMLKQKPGYLWPQAIMPYIIEPEAMPMKPEYERIIAFVEDQSCVRLPYWNESTQEVYNLGHPGHIKFRKHTGCHTHTIGLAKSRDGVGVSCCADKTCLHELGHALGFYHEQDSPKRDGWIRINEQFIQPGIDLYKMTHSQSVNLSWPYDISSIMHYEDWMFNNGGPTFTKLFPELSVYGEYFYFFKEMASGYRCYEKYGCKGKVLKCENDGYQTVLHGECVCKCPTGLDPENLCKTPLKKVTSASWPRGQYALPKPRSGCPEGGSFQDGRLSYSEASDNTVKELDFCTKTTKDETFDYEEGSKFNWPNGDYCIYRKGEKCPLGFQSGSIQTKIIPNTPSTSGSLPDSHFVQHDLELNLCCTYRGLNEEPASFPTEKPFALFKYPSESTYERSCQAVRGMRFSKETFTISNSAGFNVDPMFMSWLKNDGMSIQATLCNYSPVDMNCGGAITLSKSNPETTIEMNGTGRTDLECTWVVRGDNNKGILVMDFEKFELMKYQHKCEDFVEVRHVRIGQRGQKYRSLNCVDFIKPRPNQSIRSMYDKLLVRFFTHGESTSTFTAKVRWIENDDLCYDVEGRGVAYDGVVNYTRSFQPCLPWTEVTECLHHPFKEGDVMDNLEGNACRNPDNSFRPWCYTKKSQCEREYCDVCNLKKTFDRLDFCAKLKADGFCTRDAAFAVKNCAKTCYGQLTDKTPAVPHVEVSCGRHVPPMDGSIVGTVKDTYKVGETVLYKCNGIDSQIFSRCMISGHWSDVGSACLPCPTGHVYFKNVCYGVVEDGKQLAYNQAILSCERAGGVLVAPRSDEEAKVILSVSKNLGKVWIGVTDAEEEGNWRYDDGVGLAWNNWCETEPNDKGKDGKDCAVMGRNSKWMDYPCSSRHSVVCALPPSTNSSCLDILGRKCSSLLADKPSLCIDYPYFASEYCRRSCGVCQAVGDVGLCRVRNPYPNVLTLSKDDFTIAVGEYVDYECERFTYNIGGHDSRACLPNGQLSGEPLRCDYCPLGFKMLNDTCHGAIVGMHRQISTSRKMCKMFDGYLAMPKTREENDAISAIAMGQTVRLGATEKVNGDEFVWDDGVSVTWSNWVHGQPQTDGNSKKCVEMNEDKQWVNIYCSAFRYERFVTVCSLPKDDVNVCYDAKDGGVSYDGNVNFTREYRPCVPWSQTTKCLHHISNKGGEPDNNLNGNYCRNPDNSDRPWCYTDVDGCKRDFCDVCGKRFGYDVGYNCQQLKNDGFCTKHPEKAIRDCAATCKDELDIKAPVVVNYKDIRCGSPRAPSDAMIVGSVKNRYRVGEIAEFRCRTGHWSVFSRCLTSGQWSETGLPCPV